MEKTKKIEEPFNYEVLFESTPENKLPEAFVDEEKIDKDAYAKRIRATGMDWDDALKRRINLAVKTINQFIIYSNKRDGENARMSYQYALEEIDMVKELGFNAVGKAEELSIILYNLYDKAFIKNEQIEENYKLNPLHFEYGGEVKNKNIESDIEPMDIDDTLGFNDDNMAKGGTIKSIDEETAILPYIVAQEPSEFVAQKQFEDEFSKWTDLPIEVKNELNKKYTDKVKEISNYLVARAESLYKHNESFRKEIKSAKGLGKLYMYMNHWSGVQGDKISGNIDIIMKKWYSDKAEYESKKVEGSSLEAMNKGKIDAVLDKEWSFNDGIDTYRSRIKRGIYSDKEFDGKEYSLIELVEGKKVYQPVSKTVYDYFDKSKHSISDDNTKLPIPEITKQDVESFYQIGKVAKFKKTDWNEWGNPKNWTNNEVKDYIDTELGYYFGEDIKYLDKADYDIWLTNLKIEAGKEFDSRFENIEMNKGGVMDDYTKNLGLVEVVFKNPEYNYSTNVSGTTTEAEARKYFVSQSFNVGIYPKEKMAKVIDIKFFPKGTYEKGGNINSDVALASEIPDGADDMKSGGDIVSEYKYDMQSRPFDIGTYPNKAENGFIRAEKTENGFEIIVYSKPLSTEEMRNFSLAPITELLPYDGKQIFYYENYKGNVKLIKNKKGHMYIEVDELDGNGESTGQDVISGRDFLTNIQDGKYRLVNNDENNKEKLLAAIKEINALKEKRNKAKTKSKKVKLQETIDNLELKYKAMQ